MIDDETAPDLSSSPVGPVRGALNALAGTAIGWAWIGALDLLAIVLTDIVLGEGEERRT